MKMGLDQGVLRPRPRGRMTTGLNPSRNAPMSLNTLRRVVDTRAPRICLFRSLGGIGDVLMTTPVTRAIKREWPTARVTYATDFRYMDGVLKDLLEHNPYIDEIIPYQSARQTSFDILSDITNVCVGVERKGGRNIPNRIDLFADYVGISLDEAGRLPVYVVTEEEQKWAKRRIKKIKRTAAQTTFIGIQPRASTVRRSWPIERVRQLVGLLSQNPAVRVVVFDSSHGVGPTDAWNMPNVEPFVNYSLPCVAAMLDEMDIIVVPDSGLMHVAGALNKKMVAIFGSTDPNSRVNHYLNTRAVRRARIACSPCWYQQCDKGHACLEISAEDVFGVVMDQLSKPLIEIESVELDKKVPRKRTTTIVEKPIDIKNLDYCIVRDDGIGDLVACLPAFSAFKKAHPRDRIALATLQRNVPLMELSGCFDSIIPLTRKWGEVAIPGAIFDARNLFEKREIKGEEKDEEKAKGMYYEDQPRVEVMANFLQVEPDLAYELPQPDEEVRERIKALLVPQGIDPEIDKLVVVQLEATCPARSWNKNYIKPLMRSLVKAGYVPVAVGLNLDENFNLYYCLNLTGQTTIEMLNALISMSTAMIGVDSGGVHLAAANKIPFVAIFNAIPPHLRLSTYKNYRVLFPEHLECAPCWDKGCKKMTCMEEVTPEILISELEELLKETTDE